MLFRPCLSVFRFFRNFIASQLLIFLVLIAPGVSAGLTDQVAETVLPNGLKIILLENHKAPLVTFQVWYRVGSRNETPGKTGLSHMLEHMMFKGTKKVGPEMFSRIIQENGGNNNAFTSHDYTAYYENLRSDRVQVAMDLEADRMRNLVLRGTDFRTERMVVMEERRQRTEDNPQAYLWERMEAAAFKVSPYQWTHHRLDGGYGAMDAQRSQVLITKPITARRTPFSSSWEILKRK